jgi:hypothetical protein
MERIIMKQQVRANEKKPATARPPKAPPRVDPPSLAIERAEGEGMTPRPPDGPTALEGEGSYTAARRYDEGVERSVVKGDTEKLAKQAARALDGPEGAELREAEQDAKRGPAHTK